MPLTLREEVAEAIYKAMPVHTRNWSDIDEPTRTDFLCLANAAISIVLKRAAGIALDNKRAALEHWSDRKHREAAQIAAGEIYDAIHSLANKEPTP